MHIPWGSSRRVPVHCGLFRTLAGSTIAATVVFAAPLALAQSQHHVLKGTPEGGIEDTPLPAAGVLHTVDDAAPIDGVWSGDGLSTPDCGANCLFMFLRLHGVQVQWEEVRKEVPTTGAGASMLELKESCTRHGVDSAVIECSPAALSGLELPLIARMGSDLDGQEGHYVLVIKAGDGGVTYVDGTSGRHVGLSDSAFKAGFSTFCLCRTSQRSGWQWLMVTATIIELSAAAALTARSARLKR